MHLRAQIRILSKARLFNYMMEMGCVGQKAHSKVIKTNHGKSNITWHAELLNISEQYLF